jgi:hypothetical protein
MEQNAYHDNMNKRFAPFFFVIYREVITSLEHKSNDFYYVQILVHRSQ